MSRGHKHHKFKALLMLVIFFTFSTFSTAGTNQPAPHLPSLPTGTIQRIAFGSCAKHWQPQPVWEAIINSNPDLWLFLGDAIYADTDGKTAWLVSKEQLAGEWNRLADKPEFQRARDLIPMLATWDNHDYGSHAGGVEFEVKEASQKLFLDFFNEPENSERRNTPGIYDAKIFGEEGKRVQVILLDTRYFKDPYKKNPLPKDEWLKAGKVGGYIPDTDPVKTHLGDEQWAWLEQELKKPAEIRFIVSSTQVIPNEKGMDEWGNFPRERQRLFELIEKTKAKGVVLLSGNVHFAEISQYEKSVYPIVELTSSGMTHSNEIYGKAANTYRIAGPYIDLNFGLIEIDWEAKPSVAITLKAIGADGTTGFTHTLHLAELEGEKNSRNQAPTVCTNPRPQLCTMEYQPVCGEVSDRTRKTYANGCTACSNPAVTSYTDGPCRE